MDWTHNDKTELWESEIPKEGTNCINVEVVDHIIKKATAWIDRTEYQLDLSHVETYSQIEQDIGDSLLEHLKEN